MDFVTITTKTLIGCDTQTHQGTPNQIGQLLLLALSSPLVTYVASGIVWDDRDNTHQTVSERYFEDGTQLMCVIYAQGAYQSTY